MDLYLLQQKIDNRRKKCFFVKTDMIVEIRYWVL